MFLETDFTNASDPFSNQHGTMTQSQEIHVSVQKRTGKKYCTKVKGMKYMPQNENFSVKAFIKKIKVECCCSGSYDEKEDTITFTGDQRNKVEMLLREILGENSSTKIVMHGF